MSTLDAEIEQVRAYFAALSRRDIDAALAGAAEDAVTDVRNSHAPWKGVYRGAAENRGVYAQIVDAFEELAWESGEIEPAPGRRVVCEARLRGRGRGSGIEIDAAGGWLITIRERLVQ